jgi:uncharacterized protein YgiM (DUF1202 family)
MVGVEADYVDAGGIKWGRMSTGQWVKLGHPLVGTGKEPEVEQGLKVSITGDVVNVRTGPGTTYPVVAGVGQGDTIGLTRVVSVEGVLWGQFRAGWLCLEYTDYSGGLPVEEPTDIPNIPGTPEVPKKPVKPSEKVIATGTVTANRIYIRAAAGSRGSPVGSYVRDDRGKLLEKTSIGGIPWGRTDLGWICLTYVELDQQEEALRPDPTTQETTAPESTEPSVPGTTVPETSEPVQKEQFRGAKAIVTSKTALNIRSDPGAGSRVTGSYQAGQSIRIQDQRIVDGVAWGRTDEGWICMQYVRLLEGYHNEDGIYGMVISPDALNIRSGAGVGHAPVGTYAPGVKILICEQVSVAGQKWGRTERGWVCMDDIRLDQGLGTNYEQNQQTEPSETARWEDTAPETTEPEAAPVQNGVVTVDGLNIRRSPGIGTPVVGSYRREEKVTILETKQVNASTWGRTERGWISLTYVQLENPEAEGAGFTGTITVDTLCIRKGPGTGNVILGVYRNGETITILEQVRVGITLWGRTDKGWICMDYVE